MKKRLISILLCICFLINIIPSIGVSAAQSGKSDDVRIYIVPIIFNEHSGEYTFYGIDGKFYLSLRDIASLTRYSYSEQGDLVFLT
ncbi:MAG: hypothetical protein IJZ20_06145, partial [Clostridia bacterium]|nr:hypothetical protein [Clostridia bacterium]